MTESAAVERMYRALVREIRTNRPDLLDESFSVAEIYQNLVPYRTHRDVIGTEMSGDYEHVLMLLLAGEGDYITLESDAARRKLLHELDSIHPDTGLYRDYAACEVRLNQDQLPELEGVIGHEGGNGSGPGVAGDSGEPGDSGESGDAGDAGDAEDAQDAEDDELVPEPESGAADEDAGSVPREPVFFQASSEEDDVTDLPDPETFDAGPEGEGEAFPSDEVCPWCQGALPLRDDLRYCPHCGSHVDVRPCSGCGAEVEAGWRYCVACGSEVEG